jgi:hypothetical protein
MSPVQVDALGLPVEPSCRARRPCRRGASGRLELVVLRGQRRIELDDVGALTTDDVAHPSTRERLAQPWHAAGVRHHHPA